jgi:hypothetical protein
MPDHQQVLSGGRLTVLASVKLTIGAVDADRENPDEVLAGLAFGPGRFNTMG